MKTLLSTIFLTIFASLACVEDICAEDIKDLQSGWDQANYELTGEDQETRFEQLIETADRLVAEKPDNAELLIWQAVIKSTFAGFKGGLGALGLAKDARRSLQKAMEINDKALQGSAYTSLGALYYQVPGWPLAFGSDKKARKLLEQALTMDPEGMDANYFYGDFLFHEKEYDKAKATLKKALNAPAREGREVADTGRRKEIEELLKKVEAKRRS